MNVKGLPVNRSLEYGYGLTPKEYEAFKGGETTAGAARGQVRANRDNIKNKMLAYNDAVDACKQQAFNNPQVAAQVMAQRRMLNSMTHSAHAKFDQEDTGTPSQAHLQVHQSIAHCAMLGTQLQKLISDTELQSEFPEFRWVEDAVDQAVKEGVEFQESGSKTAADFVLPPFSEAQISAFEKLPPNRQLQFLESATYLMKCNDLAPWQKDKILGTFTDLMQGYRM